MNEFGTHAENINHSLQLASADFCNMGVTKHSAEIEIRLRYTRATKNIAR